MEVGVGVTVRVGVWVWVGARVRAGAHPRGGVAADTARPAGQPAARQVRVGVGVSQP